MSFIPCPLCGEIHEVRIHAYFKRKIRNPDTRKNEEITIFAIFCKTAKKRGDQYTKRILPPFVTPECNIMLVYTLVYITDYPQESINYAKAEIVLGAKDPRTVRKHLFEGRKVIDKTNIELTQVLSELPGFGRLPEQKPGTEIYEGLVATVNELNSAAGRMDGAVRAEVPVIGYVHSSYVYHRARQPIKIPLSHVLINLPFFDTS